MIFALFITHASGHVSVHTFDSAFARSLEMIALASHPVTLQTKDYAGGGDPS